MPFISQEGIARIFARIIRKPTVCYTSIFPRIRKMVPAIPDSPGRPVDCATDSTGFKITIKVIILDQNGTGLGKDRPSFMLSYP